MNAQFVSINELSKRLSVPAHTLRYWEKSFPGQIKPTTGAGGRRYYRDADVDIITRIKGLLYDEGYTIAGVKKMLAETGIRDSGLGISKNEKENIKPESRIANHDINEALELLKLAKNELK